MLSNLKNYNIILASRSPRRQQLMAGLDIPFRVLTRDTPEDFPPQLNGQEVALMLAQRKSKAFNDEDLPQNYLLITADTIVWLNHRILNKPSTREEAIFMLQQLSNNTHIVYTGVCLRSSYKSETFVAQSEVKFKNLSLDEIEYYVDHYSPYDKAGSYGVQEWIGYIAIESIKGSFYNVMGLPTQSLYKYLQTF
ncbi:MAG TPA: septum formation protein Maf [Bacteroidales bacterium]|jgi:septum formation protein|nr:septum formation protein Maf [Bacteroidales bacterium]HQN98336.1 Maf family nucleotide pyrophosphatase [Bacteroidales bacterium]HQQ03073.1 Maf family nucleotide pyrophosphatase [Bacteroidales bacterium]